ncbi:MAG TPA: molybdopterin molybdotransferase MoeA [Syntrophomonadaceae bacterium]|nr:molybdopterin molybdotransferase MoeA [Syntrophomonadaceae bacterium]HPR93129.1 molybdopterin molybdotransferase MoeA [Syntrophomonadaceae bacterium]
MSEKPISLETALDRCLPYIKPGYKEIIPIEYAYKRVAAEDIFTPVNIPLFAHSMVDGFALHAADINKLQQEKEIKLAIAGTMAAGDKERQSLAAGQTIRIMTGAMLPDGTAAVVKKETVREAYEQVYFNQQIKPGLNIQNCGDRVKRGEPIAFAGEVFGINETETIASSGTARVAVFEIPPVYVINTGSELVLPGEHRLDGQIFASNKTFYFSLLTAAGCHPLSGKGPVNDEIDAIAQELHNGINMSRLVIISGGTAVGQYDLVMAAFKQIGAEIIFAGLELKPGRHSAAAAKDGVLLFNLPGNPGAGYIIFEILVKPLLRKLSGISAYQNHWFELVVSDHDSSESTQRIMVKGGAEINNGQLCARILNKSEKSGSLIKLIIDINQAGSGKRGLIVD